MRPQVPIDLAALSQLPPDLRAEMLRRDCGHTAQWVYQAACLGLPEAQTTLGQMLLDGRGTPADASAAQRWFTRAAQAGYAPAANMLGRCLERGWGSPPDPAQAASCYRRAAEGSLDWGQYNLANMLLRGRGVGRDVPQSFAWFLAAARQGHAKSINLVARFLEEGWLGFVDRDAAAIWYRHAAEGGDFRAQYNLATILAQSGRLDEALPWFVRASETGSLDFRRVAAAQLLERPEPALHAAGLAIAARNCVDGSGEDYHRYGAALAGTQPRLALAWLRRAVAAGFEPAIADVARLGRGGAGRGRWFRLEPKKGRSFFL